MALTLDLLAASPGAAGVLNGTTPVDIVSPPSADFYRAVRFINVLNLDTAAVTIIFQFVDGSDTVIIEKAVLQPASAGVAPQFWRFGGANETFMLDTTAKKLQIVMSGAPATTQPSWYSFWEDLG